MQFEQSDRENEKKSPWTTINWRQIPADRNNGKGRESIGADFGRDPVGLALVEGRVDDRAIVQGDLARGDVRANDRVLAPVILQRSKLLRNDISRNKHTWLVLSHLFTELFCSFWVKMQGRIVMKIWSFFLDICRKRRFSRKHFFYINLKRRNLLWTPSWSAPRAVCCSRTRRCEWGSRLWRVLLETP